jgi:nicotinate-nucleotide pyrophosphorylase (carboxylating)
MHYSIERLIDIAIEEDIGSGDITTESTVEKDKKGAGIIKAKEPLILAGIDIAKRVFEKLDKNSAFISDFKDGDFIEKGDIILQIEGLLYALLAGERTALNFLQRLSGISTNVKKYSDILKKSEIKLVDTRKTIPGWRVLEKYAVRIGGGFNHRTGLFDGVLIKDNHIKACGSITKAVKIARDKLSHLLKIEVETTSIVEVREALKACADIIMLDNMDIKTIKEAVKIINKNALIEVSGSVNLNNIADYKDTGIDIISVGALTHSARAVDINMKII